MQTKLRLLVITTLLVDLDEARGDKLGTLQANRLEELFCSLQAPSYKSIGLEENEELDIGKSNADPDPNVAPRAKPCLHHHRVSIILP